MNDIELRDSMLEELMQHLQEPHCTHSIEEFWKEWGLKFGSTNE